MGPIKVCSCERAFSRAEWVALPLVGAQDDGVERYELRNCPACRSTLAVVLGPSVLVTSDVCWYCGRSTPTEVVSGMPCCGECARAAAVADTERPPSPIDGDDDPRLAEHSFAAAMSAALAGGA